MAAEITHKIKLEKIEQCASPRIRLIDFASMMMSPRDSLDAGILGKGNANPCPKINAFHYDLIANGSGPQSLISGVLYFEPHDKVTSNDMNALQFKHPKGTLLKPSPCESVPIANERAKSKWFELCGRSRGESAAFESEINTTDSEVSLIVSDVTEFLPHCISFPRCHSTPFGVNRFNFLSSTAVRGKVLLKSCHLQNIEAVRNLIKEGVDLEHCEKDGVTALQIALFYGNQQLIELLQSSGSLSVPIDGGSLTGSVIEDNLRIVSQLLSKLQNISLHVCCRHNLVQWAEQHLLVGANIDEVDSEGYTPLYYACVTGSVEVLKMLLLRNADVEVKCKDGKTALHASAHRSWYALVSRAISGKFTRAIRTSTIHAIQYLLSIGAEWDCEGNHILVEAARHSSVEVVSFILSTGVFVDNTSSEGVTALMHASFLDRTDVVRILLRSQAFVEQRDANELTAVDYAERGGAVKVLMLLNSRGTLAVKRALDRMEEDSDETMIIEESEEYRTKQIRTDGDEGIKIAANFNLMYLDFSQEYLPLKQGILSYHKVPTSENALVLIDALLGICELIVSSIADSSVLFLRAVQCIALIHDPVVVNKRNPTTLSCLLHYVCRLGDIAAVRSLLSNPCVEVDARDGHLNTPLTVVAMTHQNLDIVRELLKRGASVHQRNDSDLSPIHYAAKLVNLSLLDLLYFSLDKRLMPAKDYVAGGVSKIDKEPWTEFVFVYPLVSDKTNVVDVYECGRFIASKFLYGGVEQSDTLTLSTGPISIAPAQWAAWKDVLDSGRFIAVSVVQSACDCSKEELDADGEDSRYDLIKSLMSKGKFNINDVNERGDTLQMYCCRRQLKKIINLTIELGADPEITNSHGETALTLSAGKEWWEDISKAANEKMWSAIKKNELDEIRRLLKAGVDLNVPNAHGEYALCFALEYATMEALNVNKPKDTESLVLSEASSSASKPNSLRSPLESASVHQSTPLDTVSLLLSKANVNIKTPYGMTPLLIAASRGLSPMIVILMDAHADVMAKNSLDNNLLHLMAMKGHIEALKISIYKALKTNASMVKDLVNARNKEGLTPVMCAARGVFKECVDFLTSAGSKADVGYLEQEARIVERLWLGVSVNSNSDSKESEVVIVVPPNEVLIQKMLKRTPIELLYHACKFGLTEVVKHQLPFIGSSINHKVEELNYVMVKDKLTEVVTTETVLYVSCYYGHKEIVEELLKCDSDSNLPARNGWSSLFVASKKGYLDIVKMLIARGADVRYKNRNGVTALHIAAEIGHFEIVQELLARNADVNQGDKMGARPMHAAIQSGKYDVVKLLLDHGADINAATSIDITPLYVAAFSGDEQMVEMYLNYSPPSPFLNILRRVDVNFTNKEGFTPIHAAAFNGHIRIVERLLHNEANVSIAAAKRVTTLYSACEQGHTDIVTLLLCWGANPNCPNENLSTPLHLAAVNDNVKILKALLDNGALVDVLNVDGLTPLYMACDEGNLESVQMLISCGADVAPVNGFQPIDIAIGDVRDILLNAPRRPTSPWDHHYNNEFMGSEDLRQHP